ncbi:hypothetical protein LEP1GSC050_0574 [Leptospira broomii serovar Hurstbridge str. 5399]|uniref:Uncharacterized protein n=1 Tax=Leptospira broomii serovar Hurstbridge str. 5399 TaxID=1049789 RepID=T0FG15_9LEPT|nr:hypothetical protein LEP1GSC050_0574 [Leptospira broomii serovar Hurstbridge str. 5399]
MVPSRPYGLNRAFSTGSEKFQVFFLRANPWELIQTLASLLLR